MVGLLQTPEHRAARVHASCVRIGIGPALVANLLYSDPIVRNTYSAAHGRAGRRAAAAAWA